MSNYTKEDVQRALSQGLISDRDAAYMLAGIEKNAIPTALGLLVGQRAGGALGGFPGAVLGGLAGGFGAHALTPEGEGVGSNPGSPLEAERTEMLRILADPTIDNKQKKAVFNKLRALDLEAPPHEQNYTEGIERPGIAATTGAALLGALGLGVGGSLLGGAAGNRAARKLSEQNVVLSPASEAIRIANLEKAMQYGAGAGALAGIPAGIGAANLFASSPYEEPF